MHWIELSHPFTNDSPYWSGIPEGAVELAKTVYDWGCLNWAAGTGLGSDRISEKPHGQRELSMGFHILGDIIRLFYIGPAGSGVPSDPSESVLPL